MVRFGTHYEWERGETGRVGEGISPSESRGPFDFIGAELGGATPDCLTGRSPFKGKDLAELVYQVVHKAPVRPSVLGRVSGALDDVLAIAMAKDPRRRFPSAVSFAQAFVAARRGRPSTVAPPPDAWS